jgi:hemoglobin/transferrin/lactoferrin receptor protein
MPRFSSQLRFIFCNLCLLMVAVNAFAAPAAAVAETVVVTGAARGAATVEAPYTVNVVSRAQLARKLVRTLPEALSETQGVLVQKTAHGQGSPFLRGFTGYRTLTLIDGVRYNNSVYRDGPNEYFSLIDFNAMERLELLSGPAAVLYGSDAVGGTLNLQTRAARFEARRSRPLLRRASWFKSFSHWVLCASAVSSSSNLKARRD